MITIQRVRLRWTAAGRGAPQANARRGLDSPARLFTLTAGRIGRYRANFRFAGYLSWYYEDWLLHITHANPEPAAALPTQPSPRRRPDQDVFLRSRPDHEVDDRVHLYGG